MIRKLFIPFSVLFVFLGSCSNAEDDKKDSVLSDTNEASKKNADSETPISIPYYKNVTYKQISFSVVSPGLPTSNSFILIPSGLSVVNDTIHIAISGEVKDVIIDDIDGDDSPEVAVITTSGKNDKGTVYIFSANKGKSLSSVNLEDISGNESVYEGYKGKDEYNFVEGTFVRRFPIYANDSLTGKIRQFQFKLKPGEAMKQLVLDKTIEY